MARLLQRSAVLQIGRDAGSAHRMVTDRLSDGGRQGVDLVALECRAPAIFDPRLRAILPNSPSRIRIFVAGRPPAIDPAGCPHAAERFLYQRKNRGKINAPIPVTAAIAIVYQVARNGAVSSGQCRL